MFEDNLNEQYLAEALDTKYTTYWAMLDKSVSRSRYFRLFKVGETAFVVRFTNQWYSKGKIGPNSYIVSVHSVKPSGLLHKKVVKTVDPQKFLSGVVSAILAFKVAENPDAMIMRIHYKESKMGRLAERVLRRVPALKKGNDFWVFQEEKMMLAFLMRKTAHLGRALKAVMKDENFKLVDAAIKNSEIEDVLLKPVASMLAKSDPIDDRVYRVPKEEIYGLLPKNPKGIEYESNNPVPKRAKDIFPQKMDIEERYPEMMSPLTPEKLNQYKDFMMRKLISERLTTDLDEPPTATVDEIDSLAHYTAGGYYAIRQFFTGKSGGNHAEEHVRNIDSLFNKKSHAFDDRIELYRGMKFTIDIETGYYDFETNLLTNYVNSSFIRLESYTSFSMAPSVAFGFTDLSYEHVTDTVESNDLLDDIEKGTFKIEGEPSKRKYNILIKVTGGSNAKVLIPGSNSEHVSEAEVIVSRGSFLKVKNRNILTNDYGVYTIVLDAEFVRDEEVMLECVEKDYMTMTEGKRKNGKSDKSKEEAKTLIKHLSSNKEKLSDKEKARLKEKFGSYI